MGILGRVGLDGAGRGAAQSNLPGSSKTQAFKASGTKPVHKEHGSLLGRVGRISLNPEP